MSWDFFIEENLQEAYWSKYCWLILNFRSHAIKRREYSIERGVNLYVVIEYLKKMQILHDRSKQIIPEICRLFWNCYRADSWHEQRGWIISTESLRVTQQMLVLRTSAWKCSMVVSDNDNTILIYFRDSSTVFSLIELLKFTLKRECRISHL